jgi:hypothetical protein
VREDFGTMDRVHEGGISMARKHYNREHAQIDGHANPFSFCTNTGRK